MDWNNVKEGLPPESGTYHVKYGVDGKEAMATYLVNEEEKNHRWIIEEEDSVFETNEVTYWAKQEKDL